MRAMATWRQQALIEAPIDEVWALVSDPARFPEWNASVEVTGAPTRVEKGSTFRRTAPLPFGPKMTTTFEIEELDDRLREIRLRCQKSGFYSHWFLTEARGDTFADVEMGLDPRDIEQRLWALPHTKGYMRRVAQVALDGLRAVARRGK